MEQRGEEYGLIGVMLSDHDEGRGYVREMAKAVERCQNGDTAAVSALISNIVSYVDLLRGHIEKEDNAPFPQADEIFTPADQTALSAEFERVDRELFAAGQPDHYRELATKLERAID